MKWAVADKTLTAIATAGAMFQKGLVRKVLVVAPTSVVSVWPKDFESFADFNYKIGVMLGTKEQRLKELRKLTGPPNTMLVAAINYESVWRDGIKESIMEWNPDLVIADESQRIKTHDARQSKAMHEIGDLARYKLILSGTPVQNTCLDLFSQYRFLDKSVFGVNYYAYRNRYCIMGGFNQYQVVGYKNMDDLIKREHSIAYRVTKEECLDLPEQIFETRTLQFSPKEMVLYKQIKDQSYAELEGGGQITAATVLTKMLRLQQMTGGFLIKDDEDKPQMISDVKIKALEDIIDDYVLETGKKLVVFARFRAEIDLIEKLLQKKKLQYGCIYGDIKLQDRGDIVKDFQENPETKVFVAQIDTAGLGITLTAADTCVYYSVNWNYAAYSQSLARIHRIGQKNNCTYIHLVVDKTIDSEVLKALAKKEDIAKTIVDNWKMFF